MPNKTVLGIHSYLSGQGSTGSSDLDDGSYLDLYLYLNSLKIFMFLGCFFVLKLLI